MKKIIVSNRVHYIGTNDRRKHLFENNWPLPYGVSYNSYLIADNKTALIDTLEFGSKDDYLEEIESILQGKQLDYLIINHMEPDHSSMIGWIIKRYPGVKIVSNNKAFKMLDAYYGVEKERIHEVKDGDTLDLGYHKLKFVMTPWVHWPETMMTYDTTDAMLFSCDAFGSFGTLDGAIFDDEINFSFYEDEMRRYFSNIVGKYSHMVQKALAKLSGVPVKFVCPSHGPVWRTNPEKVIGLYNKWSLHEAEEGVVIAFASMYGNTEKMADYLARLIAQRGVKNIRIYDVSKTDASYILNDIWKYKAVVLGSSAYNSKMHPKMQHLCNELEILNPKNKNYALFGSYSWSGGGLKSLIPFAEKMSWEMVAPPVEVMGSPKISEMEGFEEVASKIL
ncbi:MAG: FprA family A-type flavoprotein [Bacteroidales bacterium]|nr:FprA family A-type flavoprotein [Bacteroidales bacterium]MDD4655832.1 FprA family A-type flavoprotein [Bacteroidales bacterium]